MWKESAEARYSLRDLTCLSAILSMLSHGHHALMGLSASFRGTGQSPGGKAELL